MTVRKQPQDRKPKQGTESGLGNFTYDELTITFDEVDAVFSMGFLRRIRKLDQLDQSFEMLEALKREDVLAAVDAMTRQEFARFSEAFGGYVTKVMELTTGEYSAS